MRSFKTKKVGLLVVVFILVYLAFFSFSAKKSIEHPDGFLINDISRLNPTYVKEIVPNEEIAGLQETLAKARENNFKVSIAGKRHSMGGHTFYDDAVVLDMTSFNNVLSVNPEEKTIRVQSGATWKDVIESAHRHKLAVEVMQAYNTFSVGGSMSVNVHDSDAGRGQMIDTIQSFRLLLANGTILNANRTENSELFGLVIGGYGLFGVILDADLELTDDVLYEKKEYIIDYKDYYTFYTQLRNDPHIKVIFARLSIAPDETLLKELIVTTYEQSDEANKVYFELAPVSKTGLKKFLFGLSRKYDWGKKFRWYLQKEYSDKFELAIISRNNLINNDIAYLDYHSSRNTDILQEYFIPVEKSTEFVDGLREIVKKYDLNLLSSTIRHLPAANESFLSFSLQDSYGFVLYFNVGLSEKEQEKVEKWTREITEVALVNGGTYYLPYKLYASEEQIQRAYPKINEFFEKKREYDPEELFTSKFYAKYALGEEDE
jgi:FAD/FMN-containing dehydrogenase